jgi:5'-AMP-activated protein kinase catalytic alpha subunit
MISKLFNTNPDERVGVEEIRNHPWYKLNNPEICSFNAKRTFDSINMKIVAQLEEQLGFNKESLLKSIKNNKHNHLTATYYLVLKKLMVK